MVYLMEKKSDNMDRSNRPNPRVQNPQKDAQKSQKPNNSSGKKDTQNEKLLNLFDKATITDKKETGIDLVIEGQYKEIYDQMVDAYHAKLTCGLVGPVGCGKTALSRYFAQELKQEFYWVTFSDALRPAHLLGSFDPVLAFQEGIRKEAFSFGPLSQAALEGGVFLANEVNRGDDFLLNIFLDPLEERRLYIPALKTWIRVHENFYFIATMNPVESRGTRKIPEAFKSRIAVWLELTYPPPSLERQILSHNIRDLKFPIDENDKAALVNIIQDLRQNADIEVPPSLRSCISIARLAITKAHRLGKSEVTRDILKECAKIVLKESVEFAVPSFDRDTFLSQVINRHL